MCAARAIVFGMKPLRARGFAALLGLSSVGVVLGTSLVAHVAHASVSIAITFDDLLGRSTAAAMITAVDQKSVWEGGRIYTYSRVHLDKMIAGTLAGSADQSGTVWVRTEGGIVGDIGQSVDGEAAFGIGKSSLVFLHPSTSNAGWVFVTARAQGQFPVIVDAATHTPRFMRSATVGVVLPPNTAQAPSSKQTLASDVLHGRVVDDGVKDIVSGWKRIHG
jgi:hypothetical protein